MGDVVIVAIPAQDDYVWKISSEKIPHLTLLNLGSALSDEDLAHVMGYVEHTAEMALTRFYMSVDRRGELGPNKADVLFFDRDSWDPEVTTAIDRFRSYLLKEDKIKTAYDVTPQFEGWVPHLTLGYPESPAKPDPREYPGIHGVSFDKIAIWVENFSGPEFDLASNERALAMAGLNSGQAVQHWGVRGMKWGVRRSREERAAARSEALKSHTDHKRARELMKKKVSHLSNEELAFVNQRRQLEANYAKLNPSQAARRKKKINNHLETLGLVEKTFNVTQQPLAQKIIKAKHKNASSPTAKKILKALMK